MRFEQQHLQQPIEAAWFSYQRLDDAGKRQIRSRMFTQPVLFEHLSGKLSVLRRLTIENLHAPFTPHDEGYVAAYMFIEQRLQHMAHPVLITEEDVQAHIINREQLFSGNGSLSGSLTNKEIADGLLAQIDERDPIVAGVAQRYVTHSLRKHNGNYTPAFNFLDGALEVVDIFHANNNYVHQLNGIL